MNMEVSFSQLVFLTCGSMHVEGLFPIHQVGFITILVHDLTFYYRLEDLDPHLGFIQYL